jgi:hypothetical protein
LYELIKCPNLGCGKALHLSDITIKEDIEDDDEEEVFRCKHCKEKLPKDIAIEALIMAVGDH